VYLIDGLPKITDAEAEALLSFFAFVGMLQYFGLLLRTQNYGEQKKLNFFLAPSFEDNLITTNKLQ
jgi:hypothetical protein